MLAFISALLTIVAFHAAPPVPTHHTARHPSHHSRQSRRHHRHHRPHRARPALGPHYTVDSTCYSQGGTTASGEQAQFGIVAVLPGFLPLGTHIELDTPAFGRRDFYVEDHIGSGSQLDIFYPSESACLAYGRQVRGFRVIP